MYFSTGIRESPRNEFEDCARGCYLRPSVVTRGLRCCARDRLATVPRNVRISSFIRFTLHYPTAFLFAWHIASGFYFRLASDVCVSRRAACECVRGRVCARSASAARLDGCRRCRHSALNTQHSALAVLFRLFLSVHLTTLRAAVCLNRTVYC